MHNYVRRILKINLKVIKGDHFLILQQKVRKQGVANYWIR